MSMLTSHNLRKRDIIAYNVLQKVVKENWMPKKKWGNDFKYPDFRIASENHQMWQTVT